jgi:hypothetical protein
MTVTKQTNGYYRADTSTGRNEEKGSADDDTYAACGSWGLRDEALQCPAPWRAVALHRAALGRCEYRTLVVALAAEHASRGPTEEYLVEELDR